MNPVPYTPCTLYTLYLYLFIHQVVKESFCAVQAVTPQLMAAYVSASSPDTQHTLLAVLRGLEEAAPAAALYPALVQVRQAHKGE